MNIHAVNWWPRRLGGAISYFSFWAGALLVGALVHYYDILGIQRHRHEKGNGRTKAGDSIDWERKTFWVSLAFLTMGMPALVCFGKLRRDRRNNYRHSLTEHQKTFLLVDSGGARRGGRISSSNNGNPLGKRIPKSYIRFLWFMACISIAIFSGLAGQAYMSVYLMTLPHGSVESVVYVWTW